MAEDLMKQLTGAQTGGKTVFKTKDNTDPNAPNTLDIPDTDAIPPGYSETAGGRRRRHSKGHKGNSWLAHVKATMKLNRGKSFKQVLKLAKKSYKKSQSSSSSQSGGKGRKGKGTRRGQYGGSGGKVAGVGESASPYV
jgi:hypothetical protein